MPSTENISKFFNFTAHLSDSELDPLFESMTARMTIGILYTIVFLPCFFGNLIVVIGVFSKSRRKNTTSRLLLTNLAIADLCVAICCIYPNMMVFIYTSWKLGQVMCKLYYYAQAVCYSVSLLTLVGMSAERYVATLHPLASRRILRHSTVIIWIIIIWLLSLSLNIPHLLIYDIFTFSIPSSPITHHCIIKVKLFPFEIYVTTNFIIWFCVPVVLLVFCYGRIAWRLAGSRTDVTSSLTTVERGALLFMNKASSIGAILFNGPADAAAATNRNIQDGTRRLHRCRRRVIYLLMANVISFVATVLPYQIRIIWQTWSEDFMADDSVKIFTVATFLLYYSNSAIHPILYALLSKEFRRTVRRGWCCCEKTQAASSQQ